MHATTSRRPAVVALALCAALGATAGCGTSKQSSASRTVASVANHSGLFGVIVFHRDTGQHTSAIFTIRPDGRGERQITRPPSGSVDSLSGPPGFTPDGSIFIFDRTDLSGNASLWSVHADGTGEHRLRTLSGLPGDGWPTVSPDGHEIAVARAWGKLDRYQDLKTGLYVLRSDGSHPRLVAPFGYRADVGGATWSPDGRRLVFSVGNNGPGRPADASALFTVSPDGRGLHRLTSWETGGQVSSPAFSPDGKLVLFWIRPPSQDYGGNYYTIHADGSARHKLTSFPAGSTLATGPLVTGRKVDRVRQHRRRRERRLVRDARRRHRHLAADPHRRVGKRRYLGSMNGGIMQRPLITGLVAVAAGALTAGASAQRQSPIARVATPKHNGRIVFQASVGRFPQVFTIEPDGRGLRQITHLPAKDPGAENPIWSLNGATIAFDAAAGSGVNIFSVSPGADPTQLPLRVGAFNGDPAYSRDGTQISFDQDAGPSAPKVHGIFIANADGSNARRVTTGIKTAEAYDTESQWSPNGKRLAFTRVKNSKQAAVFVVNLDGTALRRLTPWSLDAASPDWSPDGRKILFNTYFDYHSGKFSNVYSMRPDGSHATLLTHARPGVHSFRPAWSPDGTRIVFTRFTPTGKNNGRVDLYTMNPDGTHVRRVTNMPQAFPTNPDWGTAP